MDYFQLRPPVTQTEIDQLIMGFRSVQTNTIDGVVLSNMVRACHLFALKKSELIDLSITDVAKGGIVQEVMEVGDRQIRLWAIANSFLQDHLNHIRKPGIPLRPMAALFPTKKNRRYIAKTLENHLKDAQRIASTAVLTLEQIRQAGICSHYTELEAQGFSARDCLRETADLARISIRQAKGILTSNIQATGKKTSSFTKYLKEIEIVEFPNINKNEVKRTYPEIRQAIGNDPNLNDDEKQALKSEIDNRIQHANERSAQSTIPPVGPGPQSLAEAIKKMDSDES